MPFRLKAGDKVVFEGECFVRGKRIHERVLFTYCDVLGLRVGKEVTEQDVRVLVASRECLISRTYQTEVARIRKVPIISYGNFLEEVSRLINLADPDAVERAKQEEEKEKERIRINGNGEEGPVRKTGRIDFDSA